MSQYCVFRYLPSTTREEFINIGVAVIEPQVLVQFTNDWERAGHFAGKDISFLSDFAEEEFTKEKILCYNHPMSCIQTTTPRGSILPAKELLEDMFRLFVGDT